MRRRLPGSAAVALVLAALAGCGAPVPPAPAGLSVVVYQPRPDVAAGRFAIQVVNDGAAPVSVTEARLSSPDFDSEVAWTGDGSSVLAGRRLDLRVDVPAVRCDAETQATAFLATDGGDPVEVPVSDPYGFLPRLHAEQCVGQAIAEVVTVTPREVVLPAGREPATLVLDLTPTGAAGAVRVVGVRGTTLLEPAGDDGVAVPELPLDVELSATAPAELRVAFLPNRCDSHALAEDKVGTIIPFLVDRGSEEPVRWMLVLPDDLRGAFSDYYAAYCDL